MMLRTFAALLALASFAMADESCPCFTEEEYDAILAEYDNIGCQYAAENPDNLEIISIAATYVWEGDVLVGIIQAMRSVEVFDTFDTEGGLCGASTNSIEGMEVTDYGDGEHGPMAFQSCVDIMQAKCQALCGVPMDLGEERLGCGKLPFALSTLN